MNKAPVVYVPTPPEGDGITLPTLLSILAHGVVLGIVIYTYQTPVIETAGSIETTMVSPEELAEMQAQIIANRTAMQAASSDERTTSRTTDGGSTASAPQMSANNNSNSAAQDSTVQRSQPNPQQTPVFTPANDPTDTPILMSQEHRQRLLERNREYERNIAEMAAQLDESTRQELQRAEEIKRQQREAEHEALEALRYKENNPPKINPPTSSDRNIKIDTGSSDGSNKSISLSDGQPTVSSNPNTASTEKGRSRSASSGSRGANNSEIINLIKRNYNPPVASKGSTQQATLTITVNNNGDVVDVSVSGSDSTVNEAAKQAVLDTRNLPIDVDDPKYPTFTVQFNGSN